MVQTIKVLIVEDTPNDVELICRALERAELEISSAQADDRLSLEHCLRQDDWDIILSDFNLIDLNGFEVLKIVKQMAPSTPTIIVSGAIGEEAAAEILRAGAKDFISKSNFSRLVPALTRELAESKKIKHLEKLENKLRETERSLKTVVDSIKDHAIFMIDTNRKIVSWNAGAERITGFSESDAIGELIDFLYTQDERASNTPAKEIAQVSLSRSTQFERWKTRKDGSLFWASGSLTALLDDNDCVTGFAQIMRDDTDKKLFQQELEKARQKAEAANSAKSQFLANMSHEIRTPLGVILGFAEMIESDIDREATLLHARRILKNGRQLSKIIDDILDVSKVEANCLEIEKTDSSIRDLVEDAVSLLQFKAEDKGVTLKSFVHADVEDSLVTDPTRVRQVLVNLIGNAIKFTSSGEVNVTVAYSDSTKKFLSVLVKDTGKGIPHASAAKLFEAFSQGDVSVNRQYGGTGLGLYLSKRLCQALDGDLRLVESVEKVGSTFEILLNTQLKTDQTKASPDIIAPIAKASENISVNIGGQDCESLEGVRVLVIDDSIDNRAIFRCFLDLAKAEVECAENGVEGLQKIAMHAYDIVLLDIQMPIIDGYEVISRLRANGFRKPVIALTAHALESERQKCLKLGFDDHVAKPVTRQRLVSAVLGLIRKPTLTFPLRIATSLEH